MLFYQSSRIDSSDSGIRHPLDVDVLCGRGSAANRHIGNTRFRELIQYNRSIYVQLTKRQKMTMSREIFDAIKSQTPSGRFLQKDPKTELWFDIGLHRSLEKISQALREKSVLPSPIDEAEASELAQKLSSDQIVATFNILEQRQPETQVDLLWTRKEEQLPVCKVQVPPHLQLIFRVKTQMRPISTNIPTAYYSTHTPSDTFRHRNACVLTPSEVACPNKFPNIAPPPRINTQNYLPLRENMEYRQITFQPVSTDNSSRLPYQNVYSSSRTGIFFPISNSTSQHYRTAQSYYVPNHSERERPEYEEAPTNKRFRVSPDDMTPGYNRYLPDSQPCDDNMERHSQLHGLTALSTAAIMMEQAEGRF